MDIKDATQARPQGNTPVISDKGLQQEARSQNNQISASDQDTVQLTYEVKQLHALHEKMLEQPLQINHEKVAQLKQAIKDGTYKPKPESLAKMMIESELSLQSTLEKFDKLEKEEASS